MLHSSLDDRVTLVLNLSLNLNMLDGQLNTLHVPVPEPPAHTRRSSFTASLMFIMLRQVLLGTMGIVVLISLLVEKSVVPVSPQP